jgi:hypothetical protein
MTRARLFFSAFAAAALLAVLVGSAACDLNPQPLPPGEQPDGGSLGAPGPSNGGSSGGSGGNTPADASAPPPIGSLDGGTQSADAAARSDAGSAEDAGSPDSAVDGATDGSSDGAVDGGNGGNEDAALDAGDASD